MYEDCRSFLSASGLMSKPQDTFSIAYLLCVCQILPFNSRHPGRAACCLDKLCFYASSLLSLHSQSRTRRDFVRAFSRESPHLPLATQPKLAQEKRESHQRGNPKGSAPCFLGKLKVWECCYSKCEQSGC